MAERAARYQHEPRLEITSRHREQRLLWKVHVTTYSRFANQIFRI